MFLHYISDGLGGDWVGDNGSNVSGNLVSIGTLASSNLGENGACSSCRELGRMTKVRGF